MKNRIAVNGNDGMFLQGGNPTEIIFEFEDSYIDRMIRNFYNETDGIYFLLHEVAEDIGGHVSIDVNVDEEEAQLRGYDSLTEWEEIAYEDGVYRYHGDPDWRISLSSTWGCDDTMAISIARPILIELAPYFRARLNEAA